MERTNVTKSIKSMSANKVNLVKEVIIDYIFYLNK